MRQTRRKAAPLHSRLSEVTRHQISELCEWSGRDASAVLEEAIRNLHRQEACKRSVVERWRLSQKWVIQARRLPNGNLLIPDEKQDRMIEIRPGHPEYDGWLPFAEEGPDPRRISPC